MDTGISDIVRDHTPDFLVLSFSKDYEYLPTTSEALIFAAVSHRWFDAWHGQGCQWSRLAVARAN